MIIMLNLLIAIISDTYGKVTEKSQPNIYKEMACLIYENSYLIPKEVKEEYAELNKFLYVCKLTSIRGKDQPDPVQDLMMELKKKFEDLNSKIQEKENNMQSYLKTQFDAIKTEFTKD